MTNIRSIVDEAEGYVHERAVEITRPLKNECLCCYVARMLDEFSCDNSHRHAVRYRDAMAPRATALVERLGQMGACCCDCEIFLNGYELRSTAQRLDYDDLPDDTADVGAVPVPPCNGVRRGSVQPCTNWRRIRRR